MTDETTAQAGAGMEWAAHEARPPLATRQTADAGTLVDGEAAAETPQASAPVRYADRQTHANTSHARQSAAGQRGRDHCRRYRSRRV
jgi:hypothetical protein